MATKEKTATKDSTAVKEGPPPKEGAATKEAISTKEKGKTKAKTKAKPKPKAPLKQSGVWGIDLGQCALKAIRLEMKDGVVTATAFDYIEHPKILSQPDADPDQLTREALEQFLSRNDLKGDSVAISVPGQSGLARFVKLPPVEEKKIDAIVTFEAKQQIPFPLEEVVWDYQKIGQGQVSDGYALETEIGLFAMKRDMVNRALQQFKEVNVEVHLVQMAPLALCNFVAYDQLRKGAIGPKKEGEEQEEEASGDKDCIVALDIGTDNSNLVITDGEKVIWQRPIPLGGNHFTRTLTKELKLTFAKAEHIKRNAIKSPDLRKILTALRPVLNDFVNEVQRSLGFFTNTHRTANVSHMIGLGNVFRLPGLQKFLQEKLQLDVVKLSKFDRLEGEGVTNAPQFSENIMSFAVAYGLALQGLKATRLQTNLLPQEIRTERLIRAKKPWAVAAAAALLISIAGLTFGRSVQYATHSEGANPAIKDALSAAGSAKSAASSKKTEFDDWEGKSLKSMEAVKRIASGVDERHNWILVYKYINDMLPQANGIKVPLVTDWAEYPRNLYWGSREVAQSAYAAWWKKRNPAPETVEKKTEKIEPTEKQKIEKEILENLIQVNIEGIGCLYSDDLSIYFTNLTKKTQKFGSLDSWMESKDKEMVVKKEENADKLPKKGWVFEIRGFTFHKDKEKFVINTLIANLRKPQMMPVNAPDQQNPIYYSMPAEEKKIVQDKISFVCLYKHDKSGLIKKSHLRDLIAPPQTSGGPGSKGGGYTPPMPGSSGGGMPPGESGSPPPGGADSGGGTPAGPSRDGWSAQGEVATSIFGSGGAGMGGGPGMPGGAGTPNTPMPGMEPETGNLPSNLPPKTEFVILFVWQEPLPPEGEATTAE